MELRQMRPGIVSAEGNYISGLDTALGHDLMADYQPSKFESNTNALLSDMRYENVIANYAIRMEINRRNVQNLLTRYQSLIASIEAQL